MKLLPYSVFLLINSLLGLALIVLPFLLPSSELSPAIFASLGGGLLIVSALSAGKPVEVAGYIPTRIVALVVMIIGIITAFLPYLLGFQTQTTAIGATTIVSALILLTILFSTLTLNDEEA